MKIKKQKVLEFSSPPLLVCPFRGNCEESSEKVRWHLMRGCQSGEDKNENKFKGDNNHFVCMALADPGTAPEKFERIKFDCVLINQTEKKRRRQRKWAGIWHSEHLGPCFFLQFSLEQQDGEVIGLQFCPP